MHPVTQPKTNMLKPEVMDNMFHAVRTNDPEYLRKHLMHEADVDVDLMDKHENTLLHWAAYYGARACIQVLLDANADVTLVNQAGKTARDVAVLRGRSAIATLLGASLSPHNAWDPTTFWGAILTSIVVSVVLTIALNVPLISSIGFGLLAGLACYKLAAYIPIQNTTGTHSVKSGGAVSSDPILENNRQMVHFAFGAHNVAAQSYDSKSAASTSVTPNKQPSKNVV